VHAAKSLVARPIIEVSTAGLGTPVISTIEDIVATIVSILSVVLPILMVILVFLLIWWVAWFFDRRRKARAKIVNSDVQGGMYD
jgi:heme/copper-type cytochrome/quinol oxidase subunit 2